MWTRTASWIVAWFIATGAVWAQGRTTVRLLTDSKEVLPGSSFVAAVELTAPPDWHTYWRNPGDSGQRTKVDWTLPDGVTASEILWPAPRRLTEAGLTTYVYDGRVSLPVRLTVAPSRAPGPLTLQARVSWLECKTECVPGRTNVSTSILVGSKAEPSSDAAAIAEELANLPELDPAVTASAEWMGSAIGDVRLLVVRSDTAGFRDFFPFERSDAEVARTNIAQAPPGIVFAVTKSGAEWPDRIEGLIQLAVAGNPVRSVVATVPIASATGTRPPTDADRTFSAPVATSRPTLVWMLGLAFLGGLILNIMPCVLPVIALKILGFVKQSREDPGRVRFLGVVYTVGVLVSFAVLAGLIIAVQSAGKTASWGMQFQNPVFLVAITTLVTLVALNLFGVFEVTMASGAMGAASQLASKEGASGAFFNGVFTTILATPCTAPFLGAALGFAFGQPALVLLLLFLTAGLGLAAPYLLLSLQPGWLKFLPKPGNWMLTFKILMGFPMIGTALWLLSLAPDHFGDDGVFWVGMFLVCVSLAAWVFGRFVQTGTGSRGWSWAVIGAALLVGYWLILESQLHWRSPTPVKTAHQGPTNSGGIAWEPWSPEAVARARADGHPVLVDFTAKWCWTCRVNKAIAIEVPAVADRVKALGMITLRGDYTREDPAIADELRKFGRAGVPLVLVYPKDTQQPPQVLPEQLTEGIVLAALQKVE